MSKAKEFINRHRISIGILLSLLSFIILGSMIAELLDLRRSNLFTRYLRRTDVLISEQRIAEAFLSLNEASTVSQSAQDYLLLLARSHQLENGVANPSGRIIMEAGRKFPRNQDILALQVNYFLTEGRDVEAAALAAKLNKPLYQPLRVEAFLRSGRVVPNSALALLPAGVPLTAQEMADPQAMIEAGLLTGDLRYFVNAVVMYAALGKMEEAFAIFMEKRESLVKHPDAVILLKLAYDLGLYHRLEDILPLLPTDLSTEFTTILADLYFYRGEIAESYAVHQAIADRDTSGLSYVNQLNLIRAHGYEAEPAMEEALERHRRVIGLLRHYLALEAESEAALFDSALEYYRNLLPDLGGFVWIEELQRYLAEGENYHLADGILSLWDATNKNTANKNTANKEARNLLLYFLSLQRDQVGIDRALQPYEFARDYTLSLFRGYLSFFQGYREEAKQYFLLAAENKTFQASYNLGLFALEDQNAPAAARWFALAVEQVVELTGGSVKKPGTIYHEEWLLASLYRGISAALFGNYSVAQEVLELLHSLDYRHVLLPRLKEMVDK